MNITELDVAYVRASIEALFLYKFETFRSALIQYQALIAGGAVLGPYTGFPISDLDIYIYPEHAEGFMNTLKDLGYELRGNYQLTPVYDDSFFRKNHILARFRLVYTDTSEDPFESISDIEGIHRFFPKEMDSSDTEEINEQERARKMEIQHKRSQCLQFIRDWWLGKSASSSPTSRYPKKERVTLFNDKEKSKNMNLYNYSIRIE